VNLGEKLGAKVSSGIVRRACFGDRKGLIWLGLSIMLCGSAAQAKASAIIQSAQSPAAPGASELPDAPRADTAAGGQQADPRLAGNINGTLVDPSGAAVVGARVTLKPGDKSPNQEVMSDGDGQFAFANIVPGPFQITITAAGFATQTVTGVLHSGEVFAVPPIALAVATEVTEVRVVLPQVEVAEAEIKEQEKQRVLGVIPNFYVSYIPTPRRSVQSRNSSWRGGARLIR
jgi:hypothetical protein